MKHQDSGYLSDTSLSPCPDVQTTVPAQMWHPKLHRPMDPKRLKPHAVALLEQWYSANIEYPYAPYDVVQQIAKDADITHAQIRKWLANKRKRNSNTSAWKMKQKGRTPSSPYCRPVPSKGSVNSAALPRKLNFRKTCPSQPLDLHTLATAISFLRHWTQCHGHQRPTPFQLEYLSLHTGLPTNSILAWFTENITTSK